MKEHPARKSGAGERRKPPLGACAATLAPQSVHLIHTLGHFSGVIGGFITHRYGSSRALRELQARGRRLPLSPVVCRPGRRYPLGVSWPRSLPGEEVVRVEDKNRMKVTIWEAAEYLDLTPGKVQDMVERGVLKAEKFAGAVHIPREEVERIERETAP